MFKKNKKIIISTNPREEIADLKFLYIVIDSDNNIFFEYNNKGHIILPIHKNEINPFTLMKYLPQNLINKAKSKDVVGVLQLWIYTNSACTYAHVRSLGILNTYEQKVKALLLLANAMDSFCKHQNISYVLAETSVIPQAIMERKGFVLDNNKFGLLSQIDHLLFRKKAYIKYYT
ncbi:MAG: hypothetical protein ACMXYC_04680 [Candidatus Woesearchaeota archaeon]